MCIDPMTDNSTLVDADLEQQRTRHHGHESSLAVDHVGMVDTGFSEEFDNLRSDVILIAMDLTSKMAWIWMKQWQMQVCLSHD